jgi:hypothetical protein
MYDCSCDYDPPEFYNLTVRVSRKPRVCYECGSRIKPGDRYERASGKWDGKIITFETCEPCLNLRQWVKNNVPCLCILHGNQSEENRNAVEAAIERAPQETRGLWFGYLRQTIIRERTRRKSGNNGE